MKWAPAQDSNATVEGVDVARKLISWVRENFLRNRGGPCLSWQWIWKVCLPESIPISATFCMMVPSKIKHPVSVPLTGWGVTISLSRQFRNWRLLAPKDGLELTYTVWYSSTPCFSTTLLTVPCQQRILMFLKSLYTVIKICRLPQVFCNPGKVNYNIINGRVVVGNGNMATTDVPIIIEQHNRLAHQMVEGSFIQRRVPGRSLH